MKFKYIPGMRPVPMLMYNKEVNEIVFNENNNEDSKIFEIGEFTKEFNHIWNMGAYFIYNDKLEVVAYRISHAYNFLWLLRVLNKEITVEFDKKFTKEHQDFFKEVSEELVIV